MQRLRGNIYMKDGAITSSNLTSDGRHSQDCDEASWHLLSVDDHRNVQGCMRLRLYPRSVSYHQLSVREASIAESDKWGGKLRASINAELESAREAGISFVEVGGWALSEELRRTTAALNFVLATYAWSQLLGGAVGISTATERNGSASILRRLGGRPLHWDNAALPAYFDERYNCEMEVLLFDSREPNPKYQGYIEEVKAQITSLDVICRDDQSSSGLLHHFPLSADAFMPWGDALSPAAA